MAQFLAQLGAAGLACEDERNGRRLQKPVQQLGLSRLAGAFDALEADEKAAFYLADSLKMRTLRLGSMPVERDSRW